MPEIDDDGPVFPSAPPERIELPGGLVLERPDPARAEALVSAVNASLEHLAPWMAWAREPATVDATRTRLEGALVLWDARRDFTYSIVDPSTGAVAGGSGLHGRIGPHGLEIGYWVHVDRAGRGVATAAARALTDAAFAIEGIERVRICCDPANVRSARVPEKLGYRLLEVTVPTEGVCAGRPTQIWEVERAAWLDARRAAVAS